MKTHKMRHRKTIGPEMECEVHMMVSKPEEWVKPMADAGANIYTFHLEASKEPQQLIKDVRACGHFLLYMVVALIA